MRVGVVSRGNEFNNLLYAIARSYPEYMESPEALPTGSIYMVVMHVRRAEMFMPAWAGALYQPRTTLSTGIQRLPRDIGRCGCVRSNSSGSRDVDRVHKKARDHMNVTRDCLDIRIRNIVPWSMVPRFRDMSEDVDFAMKGVTAGILASAHPWYT